MKSKVFPFLPSAPPQRALTLATDHDNLASRQMKTSPSIGEYLIQRLYAHGVRHVFGIPGDYVLGFYDQLSKSKLRLINTCDEQGAGFAADAYARVRGLGVVCVTYCVGGLKVTNTTAEAFAEKSPVVVISGAPGMKEREKNPLLHHKVREVLSDPQTAFQEIDRVLHAALRFKRPVYIELPRDLFVWRGRPLHPRAHRIHQPGLLHLDGVCRARERRRPIGQPETASAGPGRRWRLPDDGDGVGHVGPLPSQSGGDAAQQFRIWHRAAHAGRPLQRCLAVAISSPAGDPWGRPRFCDRD
jgi:hypothetical protein